MTPDPTTIAGAVLLLLFGLVGWFAQHGIKRMEQDLEEERRQRAVDRHAANDEFQKISMRLEAYRYENVRDSVSPARLEHALQPFQAGIDRIEKTMEKIFTELRGKVDKPGGD